MPQPNNGDGSGSGHAGASEKAENAPILAHGDDPGLQFILIPPPRPDAGGEQRESTKPCPGGLFRLEKHGHLVTIVGRGGTGKSILSLQLVSQLVREANDDKKSPHVAKKEKKKNPTRRHTAFYFTLESPAYALAKQALQFQWGTDLAKTYKAKWDETAVAHLGNAGLRIIESPTPTQDIAGLVQNIRQRIAEDLGKIGRVVAIVIDPLGGLNLTDDLRHGLLLLRDLCDSHRIFLFLLVEDFIYAKNPWIEHFSQTVIHLDHDPQRLPHRRLHIQKARFQRFYSGHHPFELHRTAGFRLYPSLRAQSIGAHEELVNLRQSRPTEITDEFFSEHIVNNPHDTASEHAATLGDKIPRGSVLFLMGPPGTFKQQLSTRFALSAKHNDDARVWISRSLSWPDPEPDEYELEGLDGARSLFVSFKAEHETIRRIQKQVRFKKLKPKETMVNFFDSRDPILTPEEVLFRINRRLDKGTKISRAVIWGLRRLNDMPRFAGEKAVQFLEALVTLLKSRRITSLLVDWPDIQAASKLPIIDLSHYIYMTRVCYSSAWLRELDAFEAARASKSRTTPFEKLKPLFVLLWPALLEPGSTPPDELLPLFELLWRELEKGGAPPTAKMPQFNEVIWPARTEHVALLRVQRKDQQSVRNEGVILSGRKGPGKSQRMQISLASSKHKSIRFEDLWNAAGIPWEEDPGLVEPGPLAHLRQGGQR